MFQIIDYINCTLYLYILINYMSPVRRRIVFVELHDSALLQHINNMISVLDYRPYPNRRCFLFVSGRIRESIGAVIGYADCSNINVGKLVRKKESSYRSSFINYLSWLRLWYIYIPNRLWYSWLQLHFQMGRLGMELDNLWTTGNPTRVNESHLTITCQPCDTIFTI